MDQKFVDFSRNIHCLLGLPFDVIDMAGAVRQVRAATAARQSCFLTTPNLNFAIGCLTDEGFRNSVINSDLSVADGMPLVWIARILHVPIRERVAGSTLFERLRTASVPPISVYFFGGPDGVAELACRQLNQEKRGMTCAGFESPGFGSLDDISSEAVIERINASKADFLVVALGAKKGQAWIERNRARINVPVISHLGAVVNFVAGSVNRAPLWMQRIGLEWLWRIKEEPALWRRYGADGMALCALLFAKVLPYAWYVHKNINKINYLDNFSIKATISDTQVSLCLRGAWTGANIAPLRAAFTDAAQAGKDVCLELADVTYVDSAFVGQLMLLYGHQKQQRRKLILHAVSTPVRRVLSYSCADYLCAP